MPSHDDLTSPSLVWFRQDLRLADNPALTAAARRGAPVIALYVLEEDSEGVRALGGASHWWLHHSLTALAEDLDARGVKLILRRGAPSQILPQIAEETGARTVVWNRLYEEKLQERDAAIKSALKEAGLAVKSFNASLLHEPWAVKTKDGRPYRVFTPFWRAANALQPPPDPLPAPQAMTGYEGQVESDALEDWNLLPSTPDWAGGLRESWNPGEAGAQRLLSRFLDEALDGYGEMRDRPDREGTSRLSPHLRFGEISPRQIRTAVQDAIAAGAPVKDAEKFLAELGWREFSYHLLQHNPDLRRTNIQTKFDAFAWREDGEALEAWHRGRTGYPIVDAGMRELWATGYMHNRVRMIAASFLIKHLLIDWREGEAWFWDTLVDADPANNTASWQWVAGSGADAAPFFRIFNPITQGAKFDPNGDYVRRWCPELAKLPTKFLFSPWTAPELVLVNAGLKLGRDYPKPIVDHPEARQRALDAFQALKEQA